MEKRLCTAGVFLLVLGLLAGGCERVPSVPGERTAGGAIKPYQTKDYSHLKGMEGFSDLLLDTHFKLYDGYVKNTNLLLEQLNAMAKEGKAGSAEYSELKRRLGFEFNGMRLHEYYFDNLGGKKDHPKSPLYEAITRSFGSLDVWKKDFIATGSMRGIGWVVLYVDAQSGRLLNFWISEHEGNHPSGCKPLLVMDVWEHAYMVDYQLDRAKYMDAFFNNIDWSVVQTRYQFSMMPSAERLQKVGDVSSESLSIPFKRKE